MEKEEKLRDAFINNIIRYLLEENFPRVIKCINMLTEEEIWYRPNKNSNSIGNLVLHLVGNLDQWVLGSMDRRHNERKRQEEFDADIYSQKTDFSRACLSACSSFTSPLNRTRAGSGTVIR